MPPFVTCMGCIVFKLIFSKLDIDAEIMPSCKYCPFNLAD